MDSWCLLRSESYRRPGSATILAALGGINPGAEVFPRRSPAKSFQEEIMHRTIALAFGLAALAAAPAWSQAPQRPQIQTTKVDGTDNVYIFRNGNHQSIFVVTSE